MTPPANAVITQQLLATRATMLAGVAQIDAALTALGVEFEDEETDAGCPHPPEQIRDDSTLDQDEFYCRACGKTFDHHPHHAKE